MSNDMDSTQIDCGLAIHGGVGTLARGALTPEVEAAYRESLEEALEAGGSALRGGGTSLDAVVAAVRVLEDSPLYNAGRGSNYDERGVITMDASIMSSHLRDAGAVAGVAGVRSPIELARRVMEDTEHAFLIGEGAEALARSLALDFEDAEFFHTDRRWAELQAAKARGAGRPNVLGALEPEDRSGTVGAVAIDSAGALAAATSTGGMANKTWGRVGDSPVIGAGTYASHLCAVSCTGWGEYFIRHAAAYDVHARMEYAGCDLGDAVKAVIWDSLHAAAPRSGGLVAIDGAGRVELCYSTPGMYRGWLDLSGRSHVAIF